MAVFHVYDMCTRQSPSECEIGSFLGGGQATPYNFTHETPGNFTAKMNINMIT